MRGNDGGSDIFGTDLLNVIWGGNTPRAEATGL